MRLLLLLLVAPAPLSRAQTPQPLPEAPQPAPQLIVRDPNAPRPLQPVIVNGRPYMRPTQRQYFVDYLRDSYGWPALTRSTVRTLYNEGLGQPGGWGQDFPGFMQRYGSNMAITAIDGNVRYGMEEIFHEDLRYIPCHGCTAKHKIENALLAEFTARHDKDGHRFFTLTPVVADFSGPIIAHTIWYPDGFNPFGGVVATRTVFATRVGSHLFREFVLERRHYDSPEPPRPPRSKTPAPTPTLIPNPRPAPSPPPGSPQE
jgi:hypothetical protein